jgi:hypothetical protein
MGTAHAMPEASVFANRGTRGTINSAASRNARTTPARYATGMGFATPEFGGSLISPCLRALARPSGSGNVASKTFQRVALAWVGAITSPFVRTLSFLWQRVRGVTQLEAHWSRLLVARRMAFSTATGRLLTFLKEVSANPHLRQQQRRQTGQRNIRLRRHKVQRSSQHCHVRATIFRCPTSTTPGRP